MKNGRFTPEERAALIKLDAVDDVSARCIIYSKAFKEEVMRRYEAGETPSAIFASVGLPSSLIGYKRIERAMYHWKEAKRKGCLVGTDAPKVRHRNQIERLKREKREAIAQQREIRRREQQEYERRIAELKRELAALKEGNAA